MSNSQNEYRRRAPIDASRRWTSDDDLFDPVDPIHITERKLIKLHKLNPRKVYPLQTENVIFLVNGERCKAMYFDNIEMEDRYSDDLFLKVSNVNYAAYDNKDIIHMQQGFFFKTYEEWYFGKLFEVCPSKYSDRKFRVHSAFKVTPENHENQWFILQTKLAAYEELNNAGEAIHIS